MKCHCLSVAAQFTIIRLCIDEQGHIPQNNRHRIRELQAAIIHQRNHKMDRFDKFNRSMEDFERWQRESQNDAKSMIVRLIDQFGLMKKEQKENAVKMLEYERAHIHLAAENDKLKHMVSVLETNNKMYSDRVDRLDEFTKMSIQLAHTKRMDDSQLHLAYAQTSTPGVIDIEQESDSNHTI